MTRITVKLAIVVLVGAADLVVGRPTEAGPIALTTVANAAVSPGFFDQDDVAGVLSPTTDLRLASTASGTYVQQNLTANLDVSAYAFVRALSGSLALGVKTLSDGNTLIGAGGPVGATLGTGIGEAGVNLSDGLTVLGGPTSGSLALNFLISGSLSTSSSGLTTFANTATAGGTFVVNTNTTLANVLTLNAHSQNGPGGDTGPVSLTFPPAWTVFVPYTNSFAEMVLQLDSRASTGDACFGFGSTCSETALGALGNTFVLSFIQVLDQSGQIVPDAYVVGDSGINYNNMAQVTSVPEPTSMMLLGVGLAGVAVDRWRRRWKGSLRRVGHRS